MTQLAGQSELSRRLIGRKLSIEKGTQLLQYHWGFKRSFSLTHISQCCDCLKHISQPSAIHTSECIETEGCLSYCIVV